MLLASPLLAGVLLLPPVGQETDRERALDAYLGPLTAAKQFSGVVLAMDDGEVLARRAYGCADFASGTALAPDARFCIASISKLFTSALACRLADQGKLAFTDPIARYLPDFPRGAEITLEMLLAHRSGLPHRVTAPEDENVRRTAADMVALAAKAALAFPPGTGRLYSSAGYAVLARVLEVAGGADYAELVRTHLSGPLELASVAPYDAAALPGNWAREHVLHTDGVHPSSPKDYSFLVGGGSLMASAEDVLAFAQAVAGNALGERVRTRWCQDGVLTSMGSTNGYRSFVRWDENAQSGFVLLSNLDSGANELLLRDLPLLFAGTEVAAPQPVTARVVEVAPEALAACAGTYTCSGMPPLEVRVAPGGLLAGPFLLEPVAPDRFTCMSLFAELTFVRGTEGTVEKIVWTGVQPTSEWVRSPTPAPASPPGR